MGYDVVDLILDIAYLVTGAVREKNCETTYTYEDPAEKTRQKEEEENRRLLQKTGWTCSCGNLNAKYVGKCSCGKNKEDF